MAVLEFVDELDLDDEAYQFQILRVMFDPETEKYHVAEDSGCSCPSPFEDFSNEASADWGRPMTAKEAVTEIRKADASRNASGIDDKRHTVDAVMEHARARGLW